MIYASRYHDISTGHRVVGHECKCKHLHGHNYRIHFDCAGEQDPLGRVLDFGVIKDRLCEWLEQRWDHRMLLWEQDPFRHTLQELDPDGVVLVPFNPTAENMAEHLRTCVGPDLLAGTGVTLVRVRIEETAKCSATSKEGR